MKGMQILSYGDKGKMHKYWGKLHVIYFHDRAVAKRKNVEQMAIMYNIDHIHLPLSLQHPVTLVDLNSDVVSWWCKALTFWKNYV